MTSANRVCFPARSDAVVQVLEARSFNGYLPLARARVIRRRRVYHVRTSDPLRNAVLQHEASEFKLYAGSFLRDEARQIAFRVCSKRQHQVPVLLQLVVFVDKRWKTSLQLGFVRLQVCILALDSLHLRLIVKPPIFCTLCRGVVVLTWF